MGFAYNQNDTIINVGETHIFPLTEDITKKRNIIEITTDSDCQAELQYTTDNGATFSKIDDWQINNKTITKNFKEQNGKLRLTMITNLLSGSSSVNNVKILSKNQKKEIKNIDIEII